MARPRKYIIQLEDKEKKLLQRLKQYGKNDTLKLRSKIVLTANKYRAVQAKQ